MFISLEGADGVGKTTLAPMAAALLGDAAIEVRSKKSVPEDSQEIRESMERLRALLWPEISAASWEAIPSQYWTYLQVAWYTMSSRFVVEPLLAEGKVVLVDGWYYKSMAKAGLDRHGVDTDLLREAYLHVREPDATVFVRSDMSMLFDRRDDFSHYELGGSGQYDSRGRDSYVDHQSRMEQEYRSVIPAERLTIVDVVADAPPAENAKRIEQALRQCLNRPIPQSA